MVLCPELRDIDLSNNPVCNIENYRTCVKNVIPNVMILDGKAFYDNSDNKANDNISSSEYSSSDITSSEHGKSSSEHSAEDKNVNLNKTIDVVRPSSSQSTNNRIMENLPNRPSTAGNYFEEILFGI